MEAISDKETIKNSKERDPLILRCLKQLAKIDWKSLALIIAALGGLGGAVWNRLDSWVEKALTSRTQQGMYELLAQRMDEMSIRLDALEKNYEMRGMAPVPVKETKMAIAVAEPVIVENEEAREKEEPEKEFQRARLPSFQMIQKAAIRDRFIDLMQKTPED